MAASDSGLNETSLAGATKIRNTKAALLEAFFRLYPHTEMNEITVSALCREAGVNRTTFYKYYTIPSDVLLESFTELVKQSSAFATGSSRTIYENMLVLCRLLYEHRKLTELYFCASGDLMPLLYKSITISIGSPDFLKDPRNHFISGGVCGIASYWLQHDFAESPEEIARLLADCIERIKKN